MIIDTHYHKESKGAFNIVNKNTSYLKLFNKRKTLLPPMSFEKIA